MNSTYYEFHIYITIRFDTTFKKLIMPTLNYIHNFFRVAPSWAPSVILRKLPIEYNSHMGQNSHNLVTLMPEVVFSLSYPRRNVPNEV
jgi:hypothetical protein